MRRFRCSRMPNGDACVRLQTDTESRPCKVASCMMILAQVQACQLEVPYPYDHALEAAVQKQWAGSTQSCTPKWCGCRSDNVSSCVKHSSFRLRSLCRPSYRMREQHVGKGGSRRSGLCIVLRWGDLATHPRRLWDLSSGSLLIGAIRSKSPGALRHGPLRGPGGKRTAPTSEAWAK